MERMEKTFEIGVPVHAAYDQWTQFEEFPRFMDGVKEVRQLDDTHLHWRASVGGKEKEWDAQITEQVPDQVIAWRSTSGAPNGGSVRFQPLGEARTRVSLTMEYEPQTVVEKIGDAVGVMSRRIDKTVEDFREFIARRGRETGAWRGEVRAGGEIDGAGEGSEDGDEPEPPRRPMSASEWGGREVPPSGMGTAPESPSGTGAGKPGATPGKPGPR